MKGFLIGVAIGYGVSMLATRTATPPPPATPPIDPNLPVGPQLPNDAPAGTPTRRFAVGAPPKYYGLN